MSVALPVPPMVSDDGDPGPTPPDEIDGPWAQHARARREVDQEAGGPRLPCPLDWSQLWERDETAEDFIAAPLIATGRGHEIYAGAKTGKSELLLYIVAHIATGKAVLDQPAGPPRNVVYVDLEMTEDDVRDRLTEMGFAGTLFDHLHYYLLPSLPPLNTREGGEALLAICQLHDAALVIIDTIGRAVVGDENSADTIQAFHRFTGVTLKAAGVAVVRLDHTGKDVTRGARGSSAKADDVDVVFRLERTDSGSRLTATHRRVSWIPEKVDLDRREDPLRFEPVPFSWPAGTGDTAALLDRLGAPLDMTRRAAGPLLAEHGERRRTEVISAALKFRRQEAERLGNQANPSHRAEDGNHGRNQDP